MDFAYRGIYHVYRGSPNDDSDDVVECLHSEVLVNTTTGASPSDLGLDNDEDLFGLLVAPAAPINHLPTGIHAVWAVGRITFHPSASWDHDDGGSTEITLTTENWTPASNDEITEAAHSSGCDLAEFYRS